MLTKRGGFAVQQQYREQGRIGRPHPTKQLKKATVRKEDKDRGEPKKHPNGY